MDKQTKVLMAIIAAGLWANVMVTVLRPVPAAAQGFEMTLLENIVSNLGSIAHGSCTNGKIC